MNYSKWFGLSLMTALLSIPQFSSAEGLQEKLSQVIKSMKASTSEVYKSQYPVAVNPSSQKPKGEVANKQVDLKILPPLQKKMDALVKNKLDKEIEVSVMLKYNISKEKEDFINSDFAAYKNSITNVKGLGVYSFFVKLTISEIKEISKWDAISTLSIPDDIFPVW
ncbi:hypothetical protein [Paenibacillus pini]|uniref:Uncharacterized protein n=1 Tax=Paenibacillus pini JCM 16418 TaxID=1236976 RepID=W7YBT2_9BACL|nr:hypothetical protein [Paenibacillus pini]GAF08305.1 hypothetical protein JCM16418_2374 [Paenibacillus pini JCM 16418]